MEHFLDNKISREPNDTCKTYFPGAIYGKDSMLENAEFDQQKRPLMLRGLDHLERVMRIELTTLTLAT